MKGERFSIDKDKQIGETLGIDWSMFDVEQFRMGLEVELEHGRIDPKTNVTNDDPLLNGNRLSPVLATYLVHQSLLPN